MKDKYFVFALIILQFMLVSCNREIEKGIRKTTEKYLSNRFSCHFNEAFSYCSPSMESQLKWIASNICQDDIKLIRNAEEGLEIDIDNVDVIGDTAIVLCSVGNALLSDSIDGKHAIGQRNVIITLVRTDDNWRVIRED